MSELPKGWINCELKECVYFQEGPGLRKWQFAESGIPFLNIRTFNGGRIDKSKCQFVKLEEFTDKYEHFLLEAGDIVVSSSGTLGKLAIIREKDLPLMLNTSVIRYRTMFEDFLLQDYLKYYLQSAHFYQQIDSAKTGSAIYNYGPSHLKQMSIIVPPFNEQRRIVTKLEKLLGKVEACQQRLEKIPLILKRFRQAVLAAACSGKLTADWREKFDTINEFEPTTIEEIASYVGGFAYKSSTFLETGVNQVIRIGNVRPFTLNFDVSPVFIPDEIADSTERFKLYPDDLVISMTGTKYKRDYGNVAIVKEKEGSLFLNQRVARLRCGDKVEPLYLLFWLQTDQFRNFFFEGETGNVNQGNVGSNGIRKAPIELPSILEQQEIVRRVEELFKLADQIEARYRKAKDFVDKLTQSILAKAFRGELVPQDPADEPAAVLLERIRRERAAAEPANKKARSASRKKKPERLFDSA